MEPFNITELPGELQRETMLDMDPITLAQHCKVDKYTMKICSDIYFWENYFTALDDEDRISAILNIARFNQYALLLTYKALIKMANVDLKTIGNLLIISVMRNDVATTEYLRAEYNTLEEKMVIESGADEDEFHGVIPEYLNTIFEVINDLVEILKKKFYPRESMGSNYYVTLLPNSDDIDTVYTPRDITKYFKLVEDIQINYDEKYVVRIIADKMGMDKLIDSVTQFPKMGSIIGFINIIFKLLASNEDVERINKLLSKVPPADKYLRVVKKYLPEELHSLINPKTS